MKVRKVVFKHDLRHAYDIIGWKVINGIGYVRYLVNGVEKIDFEENISEIIEGS